VRALGVVVTGATCPAMTLHHVHRLLSLIAALLLTGLVWIILGDSNEGPAPQHFDRAEFCLQTTSETRYDRAGFSAVFARLPELGPSCWQPTSLPEHIQPASASSTEGRDPTLSQAWFRMAYLVPAQLPEGEALMVYVPRVMGAAWQVVVDGRQVANNLDDWRMTWNRPLAVRLDPSHMRPGATLDIRIGLIRRSRFGLSMSRIQIGPASTVMPHLAQRTFLQHTMPQASSLVMLLLGGFFFAFWLARRREHIYLLLALAGLAWCVCNLQYVMHRPDDIWRANWFASVVNMAISWVMWLVFLFALRLDQRARLRRIEQALTWFVVLMTTVALPVWPYGDDIGVYYHLANSVVGLGVTALITWLGWRQGGLMELKVISSALMVSYCCGVQDVALLAQLVTPESVYLVPYGSILVFGSLLFAVQRRYVAAISENERLNDSLAERLATREQELSVQHERLLQVEREQALLLERQRLMRDMHDGLGSALTSSLVLVEQGQLQAQDVANVLRECVDDLRLVIDSLEPVEHDLVSLLATLRYRLGRRMEHAGLQLEWAVTDLPALPWLEPSHALQVLRIVQEALTNILKHADARKVRIETRVMQRAGEPDQVCVRIEDDGKGFDAQAAPSGRGLRSLQQRASKLLGDLAIHSTVGEGTRITLTLPVQGPQALAG
jgi:signal transduction histidine kinase